MMMPLRIGRCDGFGAIHSALLERVRAILPSGSIHPLALPGGRALVMVAAYDKREVTDSAPPPGPVALPANQEVAISVLVTRRPLSVVRSMLAFAGPGRSEVGAFVLALPVTSSSWRDEGRRSGFPMFLAELEPGDDEGVRRVSVRESGADILVLSVPRAGGLRLSSSSSELYGVSGGHLVSATVRTTCYEGQQLRPGRARLELGRDHPVAVELRRLGLSSRPLVTFNYVSGRMTMDAPEVVGPASPYTGYRGADSDPRAMA